MMGPRKNSPLLAAVGRMISLKISFTASAMGVSSPNGPTRLGPGRICVQPMALRSHSVRYATKPISGATTATIFASVHTTGHSVAPR
jgi:hypothetical protein